MTCYNAGMSDNSPLRPRDPARIDRMLAQLREIWIQVPDWRLGQLILNATGNEVVRKLVQLAPGDLFELVNVHRTENVVIGGAGPLQEQRRRRSHSEERP